MDAQSPFPDEEAVVVAIRSHLSSHPQASDTAAGIQRWWVLPHVGEVSLEVVEAALARLACEGVIHRIDQAWSPASYAAVRASAPAATPTSEPR
jgi:hypothetical protein